MQKNLKNFAFFGTSSFSVTVLNKLKELGYSPTLLVTSPDRPAGRGQKITPPPVKIWGEENSIPTYQPEGYKDEKNITRLGNLSPEKDREWELFIVASYGYILPASVIYMPKFKSLNIHPSLLPKLRGPSPIQEAILRENKTGVTIMRMDEKMDHGPILKQKEVKYENWPPDTPTLEKDLAKKGATLLAEVIPFWINEEIKEKPQDEREATFTSIIKKEDAFLDFKNENSENLFRKIQAYKEKPKAFFFKDSPESKKVRVIVTKASLKNGYLIIENVIPEGKKETSYENFIRRYKKS